MEKTKIQENLKETAIQLIDAALNGKPNNHYGVRLSFKDSSFTFYDDTCGQRLHKIEQYSIGPNVIKGVYRIRRVLAFVNNGDEGKDDAVLGVLSVTNTNVVRIMECGVEFEYFTIYWPVDSN